MIAILLFSILDKPDNEGAWYKLLENIGGLKINYNARQREGQVEAILNRMIELLSVSNE